MSKKASNKRFIYGMAVAFLLPLSFYLVIQIFSKGKMIHMPAHYVAEGIDSQLADGKMQYDTLYHKVADIQLTNQLGKLVSLNKDLKGRPLLIGFFFSTCPSVCPRLTSNIAMLQKAFRRTERGMNDTLVQFISITVDPERDSFPALRAYADRYGANHDRWWFLTGNKAEIYNYARNQLFVSVQPGDGGENDFIHTEKLILVDKDRYIRGYYDGLDTAELRRCADDIGWLSLEKKKKHK